MRPRRIARPAVERLEPRDCPAVTAVVSGGRLVITATTAANLTILQTSPRAFSVSNDGVAVASVSDVSNGIQVRTSNANDRVLIDLLGGTLNRGIAINTGGGDDGVAIVNGTIPGSVQVATGPGNDTVVLGNDEALTIAGPVTVQGSPGQNNALTLAQGASLRAPLTARFVNNYQFHAGSTLAQGFTANSGNAALQMALNGTIQGLARVTGSPQADRLQIGESATIDTLLANLAAGNDRLQTSGTIRRLFQADLGDGDDTLTLSGSNTGRLLARLGSGHDTATVAVDMSAAGTQPDRLFMQAGAGDDSVIVAAGMSLDGVGAIRLEGGNDTLTLAAGMTGVPLMADGGFGFNAFQGNPSQLRFRVLRFQKVAPLS